MKSTTAVLGTVLGIILIVLIAVVGTRAILHRHHAQVEEHPIPRLVVNQGRHALLVDNAPFLIMGIEDLTMGDWPVRPAVWQALQYMNVNTVEIAIYWEDFEPQQGQFDYTVIDRLLADARQHHDRLIPLWFGTYKNGQPHYQPEWIKKDPVRYFHVIGKDGQAVDSPSPFCTATLEEDKKAFAALMQHLKEVDPQRTVIMVQVENETGTWDSVRDFSPVAQKFFDAPVPAEILKAMPPLTNAASPTWQQAYGPNADEYFHAWAVSSYVGQVAAAGKAVYPLPMDANVALRDPIHKVLPGVPGALNTSVSYESGGPTDNVIPIWKAAAPAIDILGPDNYQTDPAAYLKDLQLYHRDDNPLYLPETGCPNCARYFFTGLGLQTIGFSPANDTTTAVLLGADAGVAAEQAGKTDIWGGYKLNDDFLTDWGMDFRLIGPIQREVAELNYEGKLQAAPEEPGKPTVTLPFENWNAVVTWGSLRGITLAPNATPKGRVLVAQLGDNEFLVAGYDCSVDFWPTGTEQQRKSAKIVVGTGRIPSIQIDGKWEHRQYLLVQEVTDVNGVLKPIRTTGGLGGEIRALEFGDLPVVMHASVTTY